jgi:hypothetical protein
MEMELGIKDFLRDRYRREDLVQLDSFLQTKGTLTLRPSSNGMFTAVSGMSDVSPTGYQDFWIRDNVMIASSFLLRGATGVAVNTMNGLTAHLAKQEERFKQVIKDPAESSPRSISLERRFAEMVTRPKRRARICTLAAVRPGTFEPTGSRSSRVRALLSRSPIFRGHRILERFGQRSLGRRSKGEQFKHRGGISRP